MTDADDYYLTDFEVRELLKMSRTTVWRKRMNAGLPHYWACGRLWYSRKEVERWIEAQRQKDEETGS